MRILAYPRDDLNPYQRLLYDDMRKQGVHVKYLGRLTPSHTLNLLLLPLELTVQRVRGSRLVHLHWVHGFAITGVSAFPIGRRMAQAWFGFCLAWMKLLGLRLVWTAHNVLPHEAVFADDLAARLKLVRACDLVLVHSQSALAELTALGVVPRRTAITPHGHFTSSVPADELRVPGSCPALRKVMFFGRVREYKGVAELLAAFGDLPPRIGAELIVVGECDDPRLRSALDAAAAEGRGNVVLRLWRVPDEVLSEMLGEADAVVLPFRRVTTSGSALLALSHGRPLIVPNLPAFAELPDDAVLRYDGTTSGLSAAMASMIGADDARLAAMSAAAYRFASAPTWPEIAAKTVAEMISVLTEPPVSGATNPEGAACHISR